MNDDPPGYQIWKTCVNNTDKEFGSGPEISADRYRDYKSELRTVERHYNAAINAAHRGVRSEVYWGLVGAIVGGAITFWAGGEGAPIGYTIFAAGSTGYISYSAAADMNSINIDAAVQARRIDIEGIEDRYTDGVKRDDFLRKRAEARARCNVLLTRPFYSIPPLKNIIG
jgi:hypothetical protein